MKRSVSDYSRGVFLASVKSYVKSLQRSGRATWLVAPLRVSWRLLKDVKDLAGVPRAVSLDLGGKSIPDLVDAVLATPAIRPIQNRSELIGLLERVAAKRPNIVLEIGTAKGGTLVALSRVVDPGARIISLDLPCGMYGGGYPAWKGLLFRRLAGKERDLHLIRGDSHSPESLAAVMEILRGRSVDVLLIDADHSYAGVKQDFERYRHFVKPGGIIAFHDILQNKFDPDIDVARFWNEVKRDYRSEEIVNDRAQGQFGIGLLYV